MKNEIKNYLAGIVKNMGITDAVIAVDVPENSKFGDYTTNVAMLLSKHLKAPPRKIAENIVNQINQDQKKSALSWLDRVEIAGPGFINFYMSEAVLGSELSAVLEKKEHYGFRENAEYAQPVTGDDERKVLSENISHIDGTIGSNIGAKTVIKSGENLRTNADSSGKAEKVGKSASFGKNKNTDDAEVGVSSPLLRSANVLDDAGRRTFSSTVVAHDLSADPAAGFPPPPPTKGTPAGGGPPTRVTRSRLSVDGYAAKSTPTSASQGQQTIMVEFAHPNTHKAFHIGHLRNITTGESIVRLLESQGNRVIRANYQGDVGMHIAKALYALLNVSPFKTEVTSVRGIKNRVEFLGKAYAAGSKAFEDPSADGEKVKKRIKDFNYFVYASAERFAVERGLKKPSTDYLSFVQGDKSIVDTVYTLWKETRQWSLDYFDTIYKRVYSHYDRFYFESECLTGVDIAKDAVKKKILEESEGAIVFRGKEYGIDTRVFVNSLGLPTYEAKELALAPMEATEFGELQRLIHCVGPEQASFFKVTFKVEELLGFVKPGVPYHLAYGWVKLKHGKMSSRLGNVVLGEWLIDEVKKEIKEVLLQNNSKSKEIDKNTSDAQAETIAIGAIKYAFLKVSTPSEIAFDLKESININGDSGPYLQYTYARCRSVLRKAAEAQNPKLKIQNKSKIQSIKSQTFKTIEFGEFEFILDLEFGALNFNEEERAIARYIMQFPDVVADSANRYAPNALCTYLFQLAQAFNLFYAKHSILGDKQQATSDTQEKNMSLVTGRMLHRLALTTATAQILKNGLYLLGINTLERM
ncbi:MAG TPA: arginine--tRNA ligase [Patescibacteria group bacterium]|nr:arginine--tRNA ligase [Patescibacteria group bacterium]